MITNTLFGAPVGDEAVLKAIHILNLSKQWGWPPNVVADMPAEWAFSAKEFMSAINFIKTVKSGK